MSKVSCCHLPLHLGPRPLPSQLLWSVACISSLPGPVRACLPPAVGGEGWAELTWVPFAVVTCEAQKDPEHGRLDCTAPFGTFSYSSSCSVSCDEGYLPSSTETSRCTSSGEWSAPPPTCKGEPPSDARTVPTHPHRLRLLSNPGEALLVVILVNRGLSGTHLV